MTAYRGTIPLSRNKSAFLYQPRLIAREAMVDVRWDSAWFSRPSSFAGEPYLAKLAT
jgi:hypothetical protein